MSFWKIKASVRLIFVTQSTNDNDLPCIFKVGWLYNVETTCISVNDDVGGDRDGNSNGRGKVTATRKYDSQQMFPSVVSINNINCRKKLSK